MVIRVPLSDLISVITIEPTFEASFFSAEGFLYWISKQIKISLRLKISSPLLSNVLEKFLDQKNKLPLNGSLLELKNGG